jgi:F0F1-type ATP synthase membrane subunit b/b'
MIDNLGEETVPPALSGPDAPRFAPIAPGIVVDLALLESLNLTNAEERAAASAQATEIISDAEARAAKLIAAAVADAEDQVADIRPLAEAEADKIVQEARDEASSIESKANEAAEQTIALAEETLAQAEARADEIVAEAEATAADLHRTLEIDRELVKERLDSLEAREAGTAAKLAEADRTLEHARSEAERMTTEAGEAVDRMMRSGQMVAESQRQEYQSEHEAIQALHAQHASDLRELTERYETKVSNQNIENLELRQEIEALREAVESLQAAPPRPARVPDDPAPVNWDPELEPTVESGRDEAAAAAGADIDEDDGFVSPWMVPDVDEEIAAEIVDFDQTDLDVDESEDEESNEETEPVRSSLGPSTGLAPNARLVEGLQASAFRTAEDPRKRRRRKR